ncbi:uncharacterized protein EI90DRAFT_3285307 [Cantharellus anzutake]|uniref:uncharacterized protein n=1 Tax=Cantharellus anzutake TaxID=1750568 RepID=UPI0019075669|nr:uncharacterized protein EI90DRAFT_3285307 [Cantharellus anzutake]KAF8342214.1 hypothetical protein EI90DRAFT_3285307 [Cantharellus anzutake]
MVSPAGSTPKPQPIESIEELQKRLDALSNVEKQLQSTRKLTRALFSSNPLDIRRAFNELNSFSTTLKSAGVQKAIRASEESDKNHPFIEEPAVVKADTSIGIPQTPTTTRVQKPPTRSPVQPRRPKNGLQLLPPHSSLIPSLSDSIAGFSSLPSSKRITLLGLPQFIRTASTVRPKVLKLRIWFPPRARQHLLTQSKTTEIISVIRQNPSYKRESIVLRVEVTDLSIVYVRLSPPVSDEVPLRVISLNCLALGEKKLPHEPSDHIVYNQMSQFFTTLLTEHYDRFSIPLMLDLLSTYDTLFTDACGVCGALLSRTGRFPPVGRVWKEEVAGVGEEQKAKWVPCHMECFH